MAIAVSAYEDFAEQNTTRFLELGNEFIMKYQIYGDNAVQSIFEIEMEPCEDYSIFNLGEENSLSQRHADTIQAHIDANQFFCPKAFDLTMYGLKGDLKAKILSIELKSETPTIL